MDVTAIGEILIDLTQTGINEAGVPQFSANPGGAPANVAVAASRLGARTAFLGKVGMTDLAYIFAKCWRITMWTAGASAQGRHTQAWLSFP